MTSQPTLQITETATPASVSGVTGAYQSKTWDIPWFWFGFFENEKPIEHPKYWMLRADKNEAVFRLSRVLPDIKKYGSTYQWQLCRELVERVKRSPGKYLVLTAPDIPAGYGDKFNKVIKSIGRKYSDWQSTGQSLTGYHSDGWPQPPKGLAVGEVTSRIKMDRTLSRQRKGNVFWGMTLLLPLLFFIWGAVVFLQC